MVNVLLSTYNGEKYILEQLDSIEQQTYREFHVFIRDDGSTDRTVPLIQEYIERNQLQNRFTMVAKENMGYSRSFYELLKMTDNGDYWAFCDQDDVWYANKLENAVSWLGKEDKNIPLLYQGRVEIGNEDLSVKRNCGFYNFNFNYHNAFTSNIFFGFAMVINRCLYDKLIQADFEKIKYHDWFAAIIVAALGKYKISDTVEAVHRQHEKNTSPTSFLKKIPDGIRLLKGDMFYTKNARELYRLCYDELDEEQRSFCELFLNERYHITTAVKKAFYPKRWNPQIEVEFVLRALMLIGKI